MSHSHCHVVLCANKDDDSAYDVYWLLPCMPILQAGLPVLETLLFIPASTQKTPALVMSRPTVLLYFASEHTGLVGANVIALL